METIIYSVNIGGYDEFKEPKKIDKSVRYILFTDNKYYKSKIWEVNHIDSFKHLGDNRKISRFIKINPHLILPNHTFNLWVDHCFHIEIDNFDDLIEKNNFSKKQIMLYKHDFRDCIYDESQAVIKQKLDDESVVLSQIKKYKSENFPKKNGLYSTGFMLRNNNEIVSTFNETWWNEVKTFSGRDQLSQVYSSWKTNLKIDSFILGKSVYSTPYLSPKIKHLKKFTI